MGTHPIFESDFDCLTDVGTLGACINKTFFSQMVEETRKRRLDNLYWYSQNCIQAYVDMPEIMNQGSKADLYEFQSYCKERVQDLGNDIKNLQVVQNEADELTTKCIQLITNRIEKRRDLFADLLPKFKEHIDKGTQKDYIYGYGQRFESWDEFEEENQLQVYLDDYSD